MILSLLLDFTPKCQFGQRKNIVFVALQPPDVAAGPWVLANTSVVPSLPVDGLDGKIHLKLSVMVDYPMESNQPFRIFGVYWKRVPFRRI
jgi:hypothetical protein